MDEARRPVFDQGRRAHHADRDEAAEVLILVSDGADLAEAAHARCGVRGQREVAEGSLRHLRLGREISVLMIGAEGGWPLKTSIYSQPTMHDCVIYG